MVKLLSAYKRITSKFFVIVGLVGLLLGSGVYVAQPSYAAAKTEAPEEEIIQPFELTQPADSREAAYEEAAKLVENPKELIKAENKEEKAQERKVQK